MGFYFGEFYAMLKNMKDTSEKIEELEKRLLQLEDCL